MCPRQESNLHQVLRRDLLYPLSYGKNNSQNANTNPLLLRAILFTAFETASTTFLSKGSGMIRSLVGFLTTLASATAATIFISSVIALVRDSMAPLKIP